MKTFVEFYTTNTDKWDNKNMRFVPCSPYNVALCGSDSVYILDGRNTLETMKEDAKERMRKLKNVQSHITGFKILKGDTIARNTKVIYSSFDIKNS